MCNTFFVYCLNWFKFDAAGGSCRYYVMASLGTFPGRKQYILSIWVIEMMLMPCKLGEESTGVDCCFFMSVEVGEEILNTIPSLQDGVANEDPCHIYILTYVHTHIDIISQSPT